MILALYSGRVCKAAAPLLANGLELRRSTEAGGAPHTLAPAGD